MQDITNVLCIGNIFLRYNKYVLQELFRSNFKINITYQIQFHRNDRNNSETSFEPQILTSQNFFSSLTMIFIFFKCKKSGQIKNFQ